MSGLTRREFTGGLLSAASALAGGVRLARSDAPEIAVTRRTVRSADGTQIAYALLGEGPALVFSHGSLESGQESLVLAGLLADRYRCYVVDRRGRAQSGPAGNHSMARECDDFAAVLGEAGPDAALMGSSYGAVVALETALRAPVARLIIYEPPLILGPDSAINRSVQEHFGLYRQLVAENRLDDAAVVGLEKFAAVPPAVLADMRATSPDAWRALRDLTPTWVPEIEAIRGLPMGIDRYRELRMPMLLVTGAESPVFLREVIAELHAALPHSSVLDLPGAGHEAHVTAPRALAAGIAAFLREPLKRA
jgi:pimeloyl-ACP methyl ester carboxylesterase